MTNPVNEPLRLLVNRQLLKVGGLMVALLTGVSLEYTMHYRRGLKEHVKVRKRPENTKSTNITSVPDPLAPASSPRARPSSPESEFIKYYELEPLLRTGHATNQFTQNRHSLSAYSRATVVQKETFWFRKQRKCKTTCCVETVAISLDQDAHKIINALDGKDVSDLILEDWQQPEHRTTPNTVKYHANNLTEAILPCLVPGTVICLQNHPDGIRHFWQNLRPKIQVEYVLIMAGSDSDTPGLSGRFLDDPLLLKLFGTNPKFPTSFGHPKYQPIPLGLSRRYPQEKHMLPYLHFTNFTNPFLDMRRFDFKEHPFSFNTDVFVHFGLEGKRKLYRQNLWRVLCPSTTRSRSSCNQNTESLSTHEIYRDMSHYRFGISPIGYGYDCYRTYELLLLGVIPVIEERDPESHILFEGLPVVHMPNMTTATSKQDFVHAIENYISSDAFQNASFDKGWERLFLKYSRHQTLKASGRTKDILVDDSGRQYYQAYHYTRNDGKTNELDTFCPGQSCNTMDTTWLQQNPTIEMTPEDQEWLSAWNKVAVH